MFVAPEERDVCRSRIRNADQLRRSGILSDRNGAVFAPTGLGMLFLPLLLHTLGSYGANTSPCP